MEGVKMKKNVIKVMKPERPVNRISDLPETFQGCQDAYLVALLGLRLGFGSASSPTSEAVEIMRLVVFIEDSPSLCDDEGWLGLVWPRYFATKGGNAVQDPRSENELRCLISRRADSPETSNPTFGECYLPTFRERQGA
ncbi:hypothetical protein Tsubulata_016898 [Turnera subulata]|uniref:Uncharacterized protein n=1 Tax=Turnera subulata TaxID=218843 RepID=A0A9Q0FW13_9ROSI|nr:hypothetical protein Tsubulata_016898 [Turnera subulata]